VIEAVYQRSTLPSPVLRTDYRLRSIAAGDRARWSLKGEGAGSDFGEAWSLGRYQVGAMSPEGAR
jgi:hypothetical protein